MADPQCPRGCGPLERDEVDIGVGNIAVSPYGCPFCHWVQGDDVEFRRPPTRYILTRLAAPGAAPEVAECATIADVYYAMERWFPGVQYRGAISSTTIEMARHDNGIAIAWMREVFEVNAEPSAPGAQCGFCGRGECRRDLETDAIAPAGAVSDDAYGQQVDRAVKAAADCDRHRNDWRARAVRAVERLAALDIALATAGPATPETGDDLVDRALHLQRVATRLAELGVRDEIRARMGADMLRRARKLIVRLGCYAQRAEVPDDLLAEYELVKDMITSFAPPIPEAAPLEHRSSSASGLLRAAVDVLGYIARPSDTLTPAAHRRAAERLIYEIREHLGLVES